MSVFGCFGLGFCLGFCLATGEVLLSPGIRVCYQLDSFGEGEKEVYRSLFFHLRLPEADYPPNPML
ncbi:MAG: hypothetical protein J1E82_05500 [Muribaculaceae bacterium]|nr:hypothetical protein [Muribaculaceae bacterium]